MKLSHKKEYIELLLKIMIDKIKFAYYNFYQERHGNLCSRTDSHANLDKYLKEVQELEKEILEVIENEGI